MTTAVIKVLDRDDQTIDCRTLVDTCANANFITEELATKLRLPQKTFPMAIETLNAANTVSSKIVAITIKSRLSNYTRSLTFCTVPKIAGLIPDTRIDRPRLSIPANIRLADPYFHRPAPVDMLIGSGPALASLCVGQINLAPRKGADLVLQKTRFGWIIGGSAPVIAPKTKRNAFISTLDFDLRRFWEIEEGQNGRHLSEEERVCEDHFANHVQRDGSGRYIVALPFNEKKPQIGESRARALNRFFSLERRLHREPELKREYSAVIEEYLSLGHMRQVKFSDAPGFYLPHHAVVKPSSSTTKVRIVFDGSAKSSSGVSLNDTPMTGPALQDDLFSLLLRFRVHAYVLTGDIEKMYRQFIVRPEDRRYQRILWRDENNEIATYELNTVTFGLSSAPFLAIRCVQQLADDERTEFPRASTTLKKDLYVDDLLTGADTFDRARELRDEIISVLQRGGLNIRQWASNETALLSGLADKQIHPKFFGDTDTVKTLGVVWNANQDTIGYTVDPHIAQRATKRTILSTIARIFDPLGLLGPVTIVAKIIMQQLWQLKLDWDESLPAQLHTDWSTLVNDLVKLNTASFKRHVAERASHKIQMHSFCDASERAYGACVYIRSVNDNGQIETHLLCAKSRVAPLKTVTLARLELCSAALLANLYATIREAMIEDAERTIFWTDSTIVLNWLKRSPSTLKTFVANRVAEIQRKTDVQSWRHVRSEDNPADLLSRGQSPSQLILNQHWKHGPHWLSSSESTWPVSPIDDTEEVPETRTVTCLATNIIHSDEILQRYSCFSRLKRVVAYCLRFRQPGRDKGHLTVAELQNATERILQLVQAPAFAQELQQLKGGLELYRKSKLLPLHLFVDDKGLLRVGGRLQNSSLPYDKKHPIILPRGHHVTGLIIQQAHLQHHHAGITSTLYNVRQTYWPIDGRNTTRKIVRQCVRCFRVNPPTTEYIMGRLPAARVTEHRSFHNTGVDYCGPFYVKERRYRNRKQIKIYVAVFICFATKAVHLEVVGDLTSEAFMAVLKRFVGRRGLCRNIYSDNGTNFVGASNDLTELQNSLPEDQGIQHFLTERNITWHFTPALSPHFGGLWGAAVKSFKHHVKRVVGEELFTPEQFNTFAIEVKAILNSRPLTPLSSDPNDPLALTPGHFSIGDALTSLPEADFSYTPSNRLTNWQHIQKVKQDFWTRWHKEYINLLNVRHRWTKGSHNISEGTIVVLKEDHTPPLQWHLARIEQVYPGKDDVVRAVTVRTACGVYRRNVRQLAHLPIYEEPSPSS